MKPLLEGDANQFEHGLLEALKLERPSAALEQRMRDALGLGPIPAAVTVPPAAPIAKSFSWGSIAAGSVAAALFVSGGYYFSRGGATVEVRVTPAPVKIVSPSEPAQPAPTPAVAPEPRAPESRAPHANAKPRAHVTPGGDASPSNSASLREEIRLIDSARVAIKNDESARAIGILDQYARRFPKGTFAEEARVLRASAVKNR